jgi:hypothetical protein
LIGTVRRVSRGTTPASTRTGRGALRLDDRRLDKPRRIGAIDAGESPAENPDRVRHRPPIGNPREFRLGALTRRARIVLLCADRVASFEKCRSASRAKPACAIRKKACQGLGD